MPAIGFGTVQERHQKRVVNERDAADGAEWQIDARPGSDP